LALNLDCRIGRHIEKHTIDISRHGHSISYTGDCSVIYDAQMDTILDSVPTHLNHHHTHHTRFFTPPAPNFLRSIATQTSTV